ncbi:MAG TPA: GAF domain-containing protein [Candidatus Dormibacteraeota bacterium]|nr:GAF domain-containing protein [Candidatus Dormibacteraeota bacterium]
MNSGRRALTFRIGFAAGSAILVLAGATLGASGRDGLVLAMGAIAGLLALASGATFNSWRLAAGLGAVSLLLTLVLSQLDPRQADLPIQVPGLVLLAVGGVLGAIVYRTLAGDLEKQQAEVESLNATLGQKHHAFVAATSDLNGTQPGDTAATTAAIAASVGADLACCYLASADGRRFVPQPPGIGVDRLRPQAVNRSRGDGGPLLSAIEARNPFVAADESQLVELISFLPEDLHLKGLIAVPMPIGDHVGGFMLLGRTAAQFSDDDRRLAITLATRAGEQVASAQLVALTRQESARYSLMNELVKEASGKTMNEVLELVLGRGSEVVRYDAGRALLFQPDNTYVVVDGGAPAPEPTDGPLARVRDGETMLRNLVTEDEGIYSGLHPERFGGTVNEALTPIRGKSGVIGALCLGRRGNAGFTQQDVSPLDDLGSMAGVAVENSRILQVVSGQASRLDTALDALGEVSAALTTVTEGSRVLEQKTLEAAIRIVDGTAGMLTRTGSEGHQAAIMAVWLGTDPTGMLFQNGQGVVGATMLSGRPTVVSDLAWQAELASPPDLTGLKSAICTPMFEEGQLWGTLSVFDDKKREWTTDDQRVLATLANQGVVAVRNAELYEKNERSIWELRNLQEALQAATSTLELNQVLQQVLAGAAKASSAQIGCLALADDNGKLILKGGFGTDHVTAERLALVIGGDICRKVMETGRAVMEAMSPKAADDTALNPRAVLCVPITLRGKPLGVVFLANYKAGHEFTEDHRNLVTELATQAAVAIDNARLFEDREAVILESLEALAATVDEKDRYTAGHSERVTQYALVIARQMHYAPHDTEAWTRLERGGRLHDIGKVGVPDAVIQKTGKLTDAEFEQMKSHTTRGYNILSKLHMLTDELVIVRSHHERYDGKGYPDRKTGDELPIFAWIVSAADAIDAMTSDRPYRRGMSLEVAIDQVRLGAGTHFHPDVAEAVLDAAATGTLKLIPQVSLYKDAPKIGAFENPVG